MKASPLLHLLLLGVVLFVLPGGLRLRHLLLRVAEQDWEPRVREQIEALHRQLRAGADFARLARRYSTDASASSGDDLGLVVRRQMVAEFERVAFALSSGQFSEPLRTLFGWHLILLEQRLPAQALDETECWRRRPGCCTGSASARPAHGPCASCVRWLGLKRAKIPEPAGVPHKWGSGPQRCDERLPRFWGLIAGRRYIFQTDQGFINGRQGELGWHGLCICPCKARAPGPKLDAVSHWETTLSYKVLVVEDEQILADNLKAYLEVKGMEVRVAYDGSSAIALAGEFVPDVLVLDFRLPDMEGFEVYDVIREKLACQAVLTTGHPTSEVCDGAERRGIGHILFKPYPLGVLAQTLQRLLQAADPDTSHFVERRRNQAASFPLQLYDGCWVLADRRGSRPPMDLTDPPSVQEEPPL